VKTLGLALAALAIARKPAAVTALAPPPQRSFWSGWKAQPRDLAPFDVSRQHAMHSLEP